MAVTGAVISAVATVGSLYQGYEAMQAREEAQDSAEEANQIERRRSQLQQQENIRRAVARSRVARAQAEASGGAAGGGGTSIAATSGAAGSETTGTARNVGFAIGQQNLENQRFDALIDVGRAEAGAQRAETIGNALGQVSQFGGGGAGFANLARYGYNQFSNRSQ